MDETHVKVELILRSCLKPELLAVANGYQIQLDNNGDGMTERQILRKIQDKIDDEDSDVERTALFLKLVPLLPEKSMNLMRILSGTDKDVANAKRENETNNLLTGLKIDQNSAFRREFKISGTIGGLQKEQITYISLCTQINEGKQRGYTPEEITHAVRKAVAPGTELRTILDAKLDMTLESMRDFVRTFMKEKSSTELFKDLSGVTQKENEDTTTFVLRAMEIREKMKYAAVAEEDSSYTPQLIQNMFIHSLKTGIRDDVVKGRIHGMLRSAVSDEELLTELTTIALEEDERKQKKFNPMQEEILRKSRSIKLMLFRQK